MVLPDIIVAMNQVVVSVCWWYYLLCCNLPPFCFNNLSNLTANNYVCHNVIVLFVVILSNAFYQAYSHLTLLYIFIYVSKKINKFETKKALKYRERERDHFMYYSFFF